MKKILDKIDLCNINKTTVISIVMVIFSIVNYILTLLGKPILNYSEDAITYVVNSAVAIIAIVYPAYKNNSISTFAQIADKVLYALRDGKITPQEVDDFIASFECKDEN